MAVELATAYVSIVPSTKGLGKSISSEFKGAEVEASKSGTRMGSALKAKLGSALKGGAVAIGAATGALIASGLAGGFKRLDAIDQAKAKFKALGHSAREVDSLINDVTASVKGTAFSTSEAADTAAMALAAGIKPGKELTGVLTTIGDAAAFANKDFAELSPAFTKAMNSGKVMGDSLAQLTENGIPATQALAKHFGKTTEEISKMASEGKISFNDLKEALDETIGGTALRQGETFSGALKNMRTALSRIGETILSTPFKMGPQTFSAIGVALDRVNDKAKGAIEYLQYGRDALARVNGEDSVFVKAFGTGEDAERVMATLDRIKGHWENFLAGLRGTGDAAGLFGTFGSSIRAVGDALGQLMAPLGEIMVSLGQAGLAASVVSLTTAFATLAPLIAGVLEPALSALATLMRENQWAVNLLVTGLVGLGTINAVLGPVGKAVGLFGKLKTVMAGGGAASKIFAKVFPNIAKAGKKLGPVVPVVKKLAGVLSGGLVKGLKLAATGFRALGVAIAANPIGAIVAVIAAVVAGLVWFFTQTELGRELWAGFVEFLRGAWENIKQWAQSAWETIVEVWNGLPEWFSQKWQAVTDGVSQAWTAIKEAIAAAWEAIVAWVMEKWTSFTALVGAKWAMVKNAVSAVWSAIQQSITTTWTTVVTWLSTAWSSFVTWVGSVWQSIRDKIAAAWQAIRDRVTAIWGAISAWVQSAWAAFTAYVQQTWQSIKDRIAEAWEAIKAKIAEAWEAIKAKVAEAVANVIAKLGEFVAGVREKLDTAISKVKEFPGKIKNAFANAGRWLVNAGRRIIEGLINGIKSMAGAVGRAITSVLPAGVRGFVSFASGGVALADGAVARFASGGARTGRGVRSLNRAPVGRERHVAQIARAGEWRLWAEPETGGEAYIPLARSKRSRSTAILADVARRFGLNLTDRDGRPVSAFTPGGTGPLAEARAFADGGIRTARQVRDFVEGKMVDGVQASRSLDGAPYVWGGSDWGDCSGTQSSIAAFMLGITPFPRKFATASQGQWLSSNGANMGRGPEGTYRVGWYNGGSGGGHTSGTLPDGTNVEMGGSAGGGKIGGRAAGWDAPNNTHFAWIPVRDEPASAASADAPASGGAGSGSTTTGGDDNIVPLEPEVAAKATEAGLDEAAEPIGGSSSLSGAPDTWSALAGSVVAGFVSGQIADLLNVFGVPDQIPPLLKAGRDLFVRVVDGDPEGRTANAEVEKAADAVIESGQAPAPQPTVPGAVEPTTATAAADDVEKVEPVNIGTVTKGPYRLGADFYAEELARAVAERNMGFKAAKIAYATMLVETGDPPRMYASSVDTASQQYPHEAIGSDHDSSGLFQQRNNGAWGDVSERMNARASSSMFLNALAKVPGWETMEEGAAAQAVQRSAFPSRYTTKMGKAEQVMSAYKRRFGLKKGGLVRGGRRGFDDILAFLSDGEMVVNRGSVDADPEMARALNEDGPDAVREMVLDDAAAALPEATKPPQIAGGTPQQIVDALLFGGADKVGPAVAAATKAGFTAAGAGAQQAAVPLFAGLGTVVPGVAGLGGMLPIEEGMGVAGDVASWYAGEVSGGIAHAFAQWGSTVFGIGVDGAEDLLATLGGPSPQQMLPLTAGMREFTDVLDASMTEHEAAYRQRTGTQGQVVNNFIAQDTSAMWQRYRVEMAKSNRGKVGAR